MSKRALSSGFGLVEVLVAMAIFLVALVGGAGLLTTAKRTEFDSYQRTLATQIANTIVDRIRTNVGAADSYQRAPSNALGGGTLSASPSKDCSAATCTATQLAAYDLWEAEQLLDGNQVKNGTAAVGGLVKPAACIELTKATAGSASNTGRLRVTVGWEDRRATSDAADSPTGVDCGGADANAYRRQVILDTYILDSA